MWKWKEGAVKEITDQKAVGYGVLMKKYKLDLHRMNYTDARRSVIRLIEEHWDEAVELEIVTGNSFGMRETVKEVLEEYDLDYRIGSIFGQNKGHIITWTE